MGVNLGRKELADSASDFTVNGGEVAVTRVITVAVHGVEDEQAFRAALNGRGAAIYVSTY